MRMCICTGILYICMYCYICICICICVYVCMYMYMYMLYMCICIYMYLCIFYMYMYMYVSVCICISYIDYLYTYMFIVYLYCICICNVYMSAMLILELVSGHSKSLQARCFVFPMSLYKQFTSHGQDFCDVVGDRNNTHSIGIIK